MPIWNLTMEKKDELLKQQKQKGDELARLKAKTPSQLWLDDLDELLVELNKHEAKEKEEEIHVKTEEEYNIQKLNLIVASKVKIREEFKKKEENFKKRESELREKDILIQDHLIKFSTFLQSHEMRRKKDAELHKIEEEKIKEKKDEVGKGSDKSTYLLKEAKKIETKVQYMQKFETFLEKVKEQHPDEF
jgi:hypothetical protein